MAANVPTMQSPPPTLVSRMLAFPRPASSAFYRPDIDGLRAIAVLSVIAYHIGVPGLPGGFVGVDIFFVLSGFLISGLLRQELLSGGTIGFAAFFARRIRRLGPALVLVTLVTLVAGYMVLLPDAANTLGREARAVVTLSANHHFMKHAFDYFNTATDLKPMLHTWSLAVEEQYYLLWPLLMLGAYRVGGGENALRPTLLAVLLLSFAACLYLSYSDMPKAFYLMPTRAWEFAAGGLLAWLPLRHSRRAWHANALAGGGLAVLLCSIVLLDEHSMVFPGWVVLLPVCGTLLVLAAGGLDPHHAPGRLLGSRLFTAVGLLSYSWYLWHQPLLALGRYYDVGQRDLLRDFLLGGVLALLLAWLTYCLVEQPIRQRRWRWFVTDKSTLWAGLAMSVLVWLVGSAAMYLPKKYPWPGYQSILQVKQDQAQLPPGCDMPERGVPLSPQASCRIGPAGAPLQLLAWGDSHTDHAMPMYQLLAQAQGVAIVRRAYHGCPPLLDAVPVGEGKVRSWCLNHSRAVMAELGQLSRSGLKGVLMNVRWNGYTALPVAGSASITGLVPADDQGKVAVSGAMLAGVGQLDRAHSLQVMAASLDRLASQLAVLQLKLVLLAPEPEMPLSVPECLARRGESACHARRADVDRQREAILPILQQVASRHTNVRVWDPIALFCDAQTCYAAAAGVVRYQDQNHLTASMSRTLQADFAPLFSWARQP